MGVVARKITEDEIERNYTPEEREFVDNFCAEYKAAEEPQPDEDDLAVYSNDYKMYAEVEGEEGGGESLNIEWDAAMGKTDHWNLPPFEEFDPKVCWVSCAGCAVGVDGGGGGNVVGSAVVVFFTVIFSTAVGGGIRPAARR